MPNPYASPATESDAKAYARPRFVPVLALSTAAMAPWPLLAAFVVGNAGMIDNWTEYLFVLGGITGIVMVPFAVFGQLDDSVFAVVITVVWLVFWALPPLWFVRRTPSRISRPILFGLQSAFSLAQAAMGTLVLFGKAV